MTSSCSPIFGVRKSLGTKTKHQMRKPGHSLQQWEWQSPGSFREGGPGWKAGSLLRPHSSVASAVFAGDQCPPDKLVLRLWEEGRKNSSSFRGCQDWSGHRKPSLRVQVSRTIHTEVNLLVRLWQMHVQSLSENF